MKKTLPLLLLLAATGARAACVDQDAWSKPGSWTVATGNEDLLKADRGFPSAELPAARRKADAAIALLTRALPTLPGVEAKAYRTAGGDPAAKDGALHYGVNALFKGYYCVPNTPAYPQARGTVHLGDETGTWIYFDFNNLGWLVNDMARLDRELRADGGGAMYYFPKQGGELKGMPVLLPTIHRVQKTEAYILAPAGGLPYRFVSREELLKAQIRVWQDKVKEMSKLGNARMLGYPQGFVDRSQALLAGLTPEERKMDAIVRDAYPDPSGRRKYFITEAEGGRRVFAKNTAFFDSKLSPGAAQFVTVYLRWDAGPKDKMKIALANNFRESFDFSALRGLLDR